MKERIKQLREQALRWAGENINRNLYSNYEIEQKEYEKFAELIVEECIAQCWTVSELESTGSVVSECSKRIRKHFGVEE